MSYLFPTIKKTMPAIIGFASFLIVQNAGAAEAVPAVLKQCITCHTFDAAAKSKPTGPNLTEIFSKGVASRGDYKYSAAMLAARDGGMTWTPETLEGYLTDPRGFLATKSSEATKGKMTFQVKSAEKRAEIITALQALLKKE